MRKFTLVLLSLLCFACSKPQSSGPKKFLIPTTDDHGHYSLQTVTLTTLDSSEEMKGQAAEIYLRSPLTDQGYQGSIARPHFTLVGDTYVPRDADSSLAVAVYAEMEGLYQYDQTLGVEGQISWPRHVGVELNLMGGEGVVHDNAIYLITSDAMAILPYTGAGVPLALNHGVLGHEHFHAHFQTQVMNRLDASLDRSISLVWKMFYPLFAATQPPSLGDPVMNLKDPKFLNSIVLRGWNEGLADLNGAIYTGQPDFFQESLPFLSQDRALTNAVAPLVMARNLPLLIRSIQTKRVEDQPVAAAYEQGSFLARSLFRIAMSGAEPPQNFMKRIFANIGTLPASIAGVTRSGQILDFEAALPVLLNGTPLNAVGCGSLKHLVSADLIGRSSSNVQPRRAFNPSFI